MLTHEVNMAYIRRAQAGDKAARDALVSENIPLVKSVATRFNGHGAEWDDLFQMGCIGLIKAIDGFDMSYEVRFSTYAVPMIMGEIRRFLRDNGQIRVSRTLKERARKCMAAKAELERELGGAPSLAQVAARAGIRPDEAVEALSALQSVRSISEPVGGEGAMTLGDTLGHDDTEQRIAHMELERSMASLDMKEAELIRLRYFARLTQTQTGTKLGISQVQVSRLESRIIKKLRSRMSG